MGTVALTLAILLALITGYLFITDHEQPTTAELRQARLDAARAIAGPLRPAADPATAINQVEHLWTQGLLTEAEYGEWRRELLDAM